MNATRHPFGTLSNGSAIESIELSNRNHVKVRVLTLGGILSRIEMPDRQGIFENILCGFNELSSYEAGHPYFGPIVGRFANRIGNGTFNLDGVHYVVSKNDIYGVPAGQQPKHHLHGGDHGFDKMVWAAELFENDSHAGVELRLGSCDGEEGYPGNVSVRVRYTLGDDNVIELDYLATTDKPTPLSLTNHAYWNLHGAGCGSILDQELTIFCNRFLVVDDELIPTGELKSVAGGSMDFLTAKKIGKDLARVPGGYDHCFIKDDSSTRLTPIARVHDPSTGRTLKVETTKPAVQFYGGHFLDGIHGSDDKVYEKYGALCLETQHYPDAMNHPHFPSAITSPKEVYHHITRFGLSVE